MSKVKNTEMIESKVGSTLTEIKKDFYFNYVVPNGLQSYVGELVTEMEHIIK